MLLMNDPNNVDQFNFACYLGHYSVYLTMKVGTSLGVTCAPVPPKYSDMPFAFIPPNEWQKKVKIAELFICNERCIQGGIGYIPSLIMLLSFSVAFIKNCLM
ncbi:hypothetical protein TELCIR_05673 [Teladorsagia circumcincta]|uniref:Uncharacterized protein n=2 Tax=Teladorsagia circumcincta TaxID=45464 RepID=A0A2G9UQ86_TELCI|nr:hypothetical protein TELCIR_05673 [Teladorsagia circumcincta]